MKKQNLIVYLMLVIVLGYTGMQYQSESDIYGSLNSNMYYVFLYTPMYMFLINSGIKNTFQEIILLRVGKRAKNALKYIKYILFQTVLFCMVLNGLQFLIIAFGANAGGITESGLWAMILALQISGWSIIGLFQYFCYVISRNPEMSFLVSWILCGMMGLSSSVIFRWGIYIYNIYSTMTLLDYDGDVIKKIIVLGINTVIVVFLVFAIIFFQKRADVLGKAYSAADK